VSLLDLLFIALFLTAVFSLLAAGWFVLRRQFDRARRILLRLLLGAVAYMAIVIAVSLVLPRRVISVGEPLCFDDWCVAVRRVQHAPEAGRIAYHVDLRISSRARRVLQRERNLAVYLTDDRGDRYDAVPVHSDIPYSVLLRPQESVDVSRAFVVPAEASGVGVVIAHEGGFPIGWFIIGYDTWFRKPPVVRVDQA
jgi:hypothetical protein